MARLIVELIAWLVIGGALAVFGAGLLAIRAVLAIDALVRRIVR